MKAPIRALAKAGALSLLLAQAGHCLAAVSALSVSGNKILAGGQPASFSGNSLFWSNTGWGGEKFYNASVVAWLKNDWKSRVVRVAMGVDDANGYLADPAGNKARVKAVIDAAIANDMYVIIDWHSHHAESYQPQAIAFFQEMASLYGTRNNVIYEVYNEPLQVSWSGTIKPYAQAVINAIRAIDPRNLIIVGTPNWSQDVDVASTDKLSGTNIAYTLHFYAATHGQSLRDKAQTALNNGAALFVTEWGSVQASGDGAVDAAQTAAWVSFMKANGISNANWALNDKAEGASALVPGASTSGGWSAGQLTASGTLARQIISGWPDTAPVGNTCAYVALPAVVRAQAYCQMSGVQAEPTTDAGGGSDIGYIDAGDWMTYTVDVPSAATYTVKYRVASLNGGGLLQLERGGGGATYGSLAVPATGGWQNWTTISHDVALPAGKQTIAVRALQGGFNVNWLDLRPAGAPTQPALTVQAEAYDYMSGVQLEATTDAGGGQDVGWIDAGDWLSYPAVNIPGSGTYLVEFRVASLNGGGRLSFEEAGGSTVYGVSSIPATGGWQNWVTVQQQVQLAAGSHRFGIGVPAGGWNLNWYRITKVQ